MFANNFFYSTQLEFKFLNNMFKINEFFTSLSNRIESCATLLFFKYEVNNIVNNLNNCIKLRSFSSAFEFENLINLLNINKFAKTKAKKKI